MFDTNVEEIIRYLREKQDEIEYAIRRRLLEQQRIRRDIEQMEYQMEKIRKNLQYLTCTKACYEKTVREVEKKSLGLDEKENSTKEDTEEGYQTYEEEEHSSVDNKNRKIIKKYIGNAILTLDEASSDDLF